MKRSDDDLHDCYHSPHHDAEKCGIDQCCGKTCYTEYFGKGGTCPSDKIARNPQDFHQPSSGIFNEAECCNDPSPCDPQGGAPPSTTHTCNAHPKGCEEARAMICGNGCYAKCWAASTNEYTASQLKLLCPQSEYNTANVCNGISPSPSPSPPSTSCLGGGCCGAATEYQNGRCVPTYDAMEKACENGAVQGLEWFCQPLIDATCD
eukprot:g4166.t1